MGAGPCGSRARAGSDSGRDTHTRLQCCTACHDKYSINIVEVLRRNRAGAACGLRAADLVYLGCPDVP